jgi:hypothetical protein
MENKIHKISKIGDNSDLEKSALEQTIVSILGRIGEFSSGTGFGLQALKEGIYSKSPAERYESLYDARDTLEFYKGAEKDLSLTAIKNDDEKSVREKLKCQISDKAIDTIIDLKNKGKL